MKKILLLVYIPTHFVELFRVAKLVKHTDVYDPLIVIFGKYKNYKRDIQLCDSHGIHWLFFFKKDYQDYPIKENNIHGDNALPTLESQTVDEKLIVLINRLPLIFKRPINFAVDLLMKFNRLLLNIFPFFLYLKYYFLAKNLILQEKINLLVLTENNVADATGIWLKLSQALRIPSVIVPFTIANAREAAEYLVSFDKTIINEMNTIIVKLFFPQWVYRYKNQDLIRLPLNKILAQEILGIAPPNPWFINSGDVDAIAVENRAMLDYYQKEKIPEEKFVLTGSLTDDHMLEILNNKMEKKVWLCSELGLKLDYPILLCALPTDWATHSSEFPTHKELIEYWAKILGNVRNWNIVLKIHPRENKADYDFLEHYNVKLSMSDTADLIPLCDLYVASVSATIRWAIACGIPVVNYDVYQFHYADYADVPGVLTVYDQVSFEKEIKLLTSEAQYFQELKDKQMANKDRWGMLDGHVSERILNLFAELISKYEGK